MVKAWKIEDNVTFLGVINQKKLEKKWKMRWHFVQHSIIADDGDEGNACSRIRGASSGTTCDIYHHAYSDVVIDGQTWFLVQETDILCYERCHDKIINNKDFMKVMALKGGIE
jgi:hypothetical protein